MKTRSSISLCLTLLLASAGGVAADADWVSYRDAYRSMIRFEKYGKPKQLLQNHYQVVAREPGASLDGLRLSLNGKSGALNLALDATGRVVFPLSKAAYDENAILSLNRSASLFTFVARISISPRADGVYDVAELRAACEQALNYLREHGDAAVKGKQCAGVKFAYPRKGAETPVKLRGAEREAQALPQVDGPAFWDASGETYRTAVYRFGGAPDKGQLLTGGAPLAISPVFD